MDIIWNVIPRKEEGGKHEGNMCFGSWIRRKDPPSFPGSGSVKKLTEAEPGVKGK